jgi:cell division protein FtsW (lipid II flippase)
LLFLVINVAIIFHLPENMQILREHQRNRITSMISLTKQETRNVKSTGFQQYTAMNLIGAGGITGYSSKDSATLVDLNGLPEGHNDMVFAIIVNRWGLLGALTVLGLYFLMLSAMLLVAARSKDPFVRLTTVGFVGLIGAQITVNIGMNIGLLPIIGITLPFISYGGSSLVASFIMIGMVLNFASRRAQILARPSFEFDNPDAIFQ